MCTRCANVSFADSSFVVEAGSGIAAVDAGLIFFSPSCSIECISGTVANVEQFATRAFLSTLVTSGAISCRRCDGGEYTLKRSHVEPVTLQPVNDQCSRCPVGAR